VVLSLRNGETLERHVAHNLGTPDNPMTDRQLEDKLDALASPVLGRGRTAELAAACWRFLEIDDMRELLQLTLPG
jgi:2-methylcitrate dehydratase PrpD